MIDHLMTIDDEPIDQKLYKRLIERSGLVGTLHQHLGGETALDFFANPDRPEIDAILLDINMPGMNGFEFLHAATTRFGTHFVKCAVIMLSTSAREEDKARAHSFDVVHGFMTKPLTLDALRQVDTRLAELCGAQVQPPAA
ncbi:response regulator [Sagittula stellata]|uniref:Response regulator n=1 Tax=Sagittula stellata (strain ATCC 700073 / DSM 11524 / E-37) TaxID=388399 RepID=A3K1A6_SAGS3|nr:response regulator [Sagittula stellata]EBA08702.1 response regulator [Sagittula stellata E-37]